MTNPRAAYEYNKDRRRWQEACARADEVIAGLEEKVNDAEWYFTQVSRSPLEAITGMQVVTLASTGTSDDNWTDLWEGIRAVREAAGK